MSVDVVDSISFSVTDGWEPVREQRVSSDHGAMLSTGRHKKGSSGALLPENLSDKTLLVGNFT